MNAAAAIAKILKAEGTEYLFSFPVNPLIEECAKIDIRPIVTRTERTLINMADGYARASNGRRIGVASVQHGPGAENAYAGVAQAFADGSPLLYMPGGNARARRDTVPHYEAATSYESVTQWSAIVNAADRVPDMMRRAFTLLRTGRPAPVCLEVPVDVATEEVKDFNYTPAPRIRSAGDPHDVREAVNILLKAKRPLLHVGQGVLWSEAWDELRAFAELVHVPVMTTLPGKSALAENHPLSIGNGGYSETAMVDHFLGQADLIFGLGCSFTTSVFSVPIPKDKTIVHVTNNPGDLNKDLSADQAILGDAKLVLQQLIEEVKRQGKPTWESPVQEIATRKKAWLAEWQPKLTSNEVPINPYRVIHDLMQVVDRQNSIITHDAGLPRDMLAPFWETRIPRGYLGWGKSSQLGSSLGFALGAKLSEPDKLVIHFLGDTAIGMCGMDLETAARERISILTVLINNGTMGGYESYIPIAGKKYRSRYLTGDYVKLAEGLGVHTERVTQPREIIPALRRAVAVTTGGPEGMGRPALVEIMTCEETKISKA